MANIKSAEKQNRQRLKHEARNRAGRSTVRTALKKVRAAIAAKNPEEAKAALAPAIRLLARAGRSGLMKRNSTDRAISRITRAVATV